MGGWCCAPTAPIDGEWAPAFRLGSAGEAAAAPTRLPLDPAMRPLAKSRGDPDALLVLAVVMGSDVELRRICVPGIGGPCDPPGPGRMVEPRLLLLKPLPISCEMLVSSARMIGVPERRSLPAPLLALLAAEAGADGGYSVAGMPPCPCAECATCAGVTGATGGFGVFLAGDTLDVTDAAPCTAGGEGEPVLLTGEKDECCGPGNDGALGKVGGPTDTAASATVDGVMGPAPGVVVGVIVAAAVAGEMVDGGGELDEEAREPEDDPRVEKGIATTGTGSAAAAAVASDGGDGALT